MRTPSQEFADMLLHQPDRVASYLKSYQWKEDFPATLMALYGRVRPEWVEAMEEAALSPETVKKSLCMLLSSEASWDGIESYARFLLHRYDWKNDDFLFHRAAVSGRHEFFPLFIEKNPQFDWNEGNEHKETPLFLALKNRHVRASVDILKNGGNELHIMKKTDKTKSESVLGVLFKNPTFKQFWSVVSNLHLLEKGVEQNLTAKLKSDKKKKKKI